MTYYFDEIIDRRNTNSLKWDVEEKELPMWVADMDFQTAREIREAIEKRAAHGVFGYSIIPEEWQRAYVDWWKLRHHFTMEKDWLIFCTGVIPAISSTVRKLTTPAEKVVVMTPVYNIFFNSIYNNGRNVLENKLIYEEDKKLHIYSGASCIGQGLGTVLTQMIVSNTDIKREDIIYERSNTWISPDSGTTSGSRQTLITGEACRRACEKLMEDKKAGLSVEDMIGKVYYAEYLAKTDPLGANVPNPVSHVAYGYATQVCILDSKTGKIEEIVAAHDVGKAVNPLSCEGQIEGGVVMSIGFALREKYPIDENCKPISKYGSLGLFRAHEIPKIDAIVIDKPGLKVACGAIGIGEITSIPTAPAIADAYFRRDGVRRYSLPLSDTPYERKG